MRAKAALRTGFGVALDAARSSRWLPDQPVTSSARWSPEQAHTWRSGQGWLIGCNFLPSTAGNQLEMFQAETFDPATIGRELGWAADLGCNSIRLFLHDLLWRNDGGFLDRVDHVLELADGVGIGVMPVLFDGVWNPEPRLGDQGRPRPGVHNSMWVQSPGAALIPDRSRWPELHEYVDAVLVRFGADPRVQVWDLFNEPDNPNGFTYPATELADKRSAVTPLVDAIFDWATEADPAQPLTVGIWTGVHGRPERVSRLNRISLARSDVLSFHSYRRTRRCAGRSCTSPDTGARCCAPNGWHDPPVPPSTSSRTSLTSASGRTPGVWSRDGRRRSTPGRPGSGQVVVSPTPGSTICSVPMGAPTTPTRRSSSAASPARSRPHHDRCAAALGDPGICPSSAGAGLPMDRHGHGGSS